MEKTLFDVLKHLNLQKRADILASKLFCVLLCCDKSDIRD